MGDPIPPEILGPLEIVVTCHDSLDFTICFRFFDCLARLASLTVVCFSSWHRLREICVRILAVEPLAWHTSRSEGYSGFPFNKKLYPLVNKHSYGKWHRNSGFSHRKWWFSIATLVITRGCSDEMSQTTKTPAYLRKIPRKWHILFQLEKDPARQQYICTLWLIIWNHRETMDNLWIVYG